MAKVTEPSRRVRVGCEYVHVAAVDTPTSSRWEPPAAAPISDARQERSMQPHLRIHRYTDFLRQPVRADRTFRRAVRAALRRPGAHSPT
jgi:hypothetical protein